jgi:hypothetical protein
MSADPCKKEREAMAAAIRKLNLAPAPSVNSKTSEETTPADVEPKADFLAELDAGKIREEAIAAYHKALAALEECDKRHREITEGPTKPLKPKE